MALQIKPENDKSEPLEDHSGRKTTNQNKVGPALRAGREKAATEGCATRSEKPAGKNKQPATSSKEPEASSQRPMKYNSTSLEAMICPI